MRPISWVQRFERQSLVDRILQNAGLMDTEGNLPITVEGLERPKNSDGILLEAARSNLHAAVLALLSSDILGQAEAEKEAAAFIWKFLFGIRRIKPG